MAGDLIAIGIRTPLADPKAALDKVQALARARGGWGQLLDADAVLGPDHLVSALDHARRAFDQGRNATESIAMEFLLYASGERQISKAIRAAGVKPGRVFVVILSGGLSAEDLLAATGWEWDDSLLEPTVQRLRG